MDISDRHCFLGNICNWNNHRILLALAIEETRGSAHPILEMGIGQENTPQLHDYCERERRLLVSMEENILGFGAYLALASDRHEFRCVSWDAAPIESQLWSVALLNHAPGERRWIDAMRLAERCEILVLRDTEPAAELGYGWNNIWRHFRSRVDIKANGAWSSAVSNSRDLSAWRGMRYGEHVVSGAGDDLRADPVREKIERAVFPDAGMFEE